MSVYVKTRNGTYSNCVFCQRYSTTEVGIDSSNYDRCYAVCNSMSCQEKAIEKMTEISEKLGLSKPKKESKSSSKRERETADVSHIPWDLEGWGQKRLEKLSSAELVELCTDRGVPKSGTKGERALNLVTWKKNGYVWNSKKGRY